jgi:hypothetical protein
MKFIEKELGESADKHDKHKTSMEDRMEFLERQVGDSAEKHWKEIVDLKGKHGDMSKSLAGCAKHEHHATLEERVKFIEKEMGESADKHDKHKTSLETRMEFIEAKLGDSAEKHAKEIEALKGKHMDLHEAVSQCAKQKHHSSLEERIKFIEKEMGESADKHDKHKTTVEDRMEFLEAKIGDSAEKHWKEIQAAKTKLGDLHQAVSQCAQQTGHSSLEKCMAFVEKELGESADKHDKHKTTMEERMEFLEAKIGDSAEKHWKEIQALQKKSGDIHDAVKQCAKMDHASSLDKRLGFIENMVGDNADKHAKALYEHQAGFKEHKESMDTRLEYLEALLGDSADKHAKEIDAAKKKLGSIEAAVQKCAKSEHHSTLEKRVSEMEKDLGMKTGDHANRLEGAERMLKEMGITLDGKGHKSEIEKLEAVVLNGIERRLSAVEEKHMRDFVKRLTDYEKKNMQEFEQVKGKMSEIDRALKECASIEHYLGMDKKHGILSQQQAEIAEIFKENMQDVDGKIDAQGVRVDGVKAFVEQRLRTLESKIDAGAKFNDIMKDFEQRCNYMEEDSKRARGILESSLEEKIRLEHSSIHSQANQIKEIYDREVRARQAYQENYQELLKQERTARESGDSNFGNRLEIFERSIYSELQRVWQELGKEHQPIVIQQPAPMPMPIAPPIVEKFMAPPAISYAQPAYSTVIGTNTLPHYSTMGTSYPTPIATSMRAPLATFAGSTSLSIPPTSISIPPTPIVEYMTPTVMEPMIETFTRMA